MNNGWARARSTGHVPCAKKDITIKENSLSGSSWQAICKGRVYFCSWETNGGSGGQVSCIADSN